MFAVITGATKGIGRAIAEKLAAEGFSLALVARHPNELRETKQDLIRRFPLISADVFQADLEDPADVDRLCLDLGSLPVVDVLVNNAGLFVPQRFFDEEPGLLDRHYLVNVLAPYKLCRSLGVRMRQEKRGHIFNILSVASIEPVVHAASYTVTKHALLGLTNVLREEMRPSGVKVTAVIPGSTLTASWEGTSVEPEKFIQPQDIAEAVFTAIQLSPGANLDQLLIRPVSGQI